MMGEIRFSELATRCPGSAFGQDIAIRSVTIDSRKCVAGDIFVAIRGEKFDGHDFLPEVARAGVAGVIVSRPVDVSVPVLRVDDTRIALGQIGAINRDRFQGPVIAVTGSAGKTTVKEMMAAIMAQMGQVLATRGNLNNDIGVPLTLMRMTDSDQFAVIELGASGQGEIAYAGALVRPDVVVLNNAGAAHLEGFGGYDGVVQAKGEIIDIVNPGGTVVLNLDDPAYPIWKRRAGTKTVASFAMANPAADYSVAATTSDGRFVVRGPDGWSLEIGLALSGEHNLRNAVAAIAATRAAGASDAAIQSGLAGLQPIAGRGQVMRLPAGGRVIDDTYNANPTSVIAALRTLAPSTGTRIAVLGDMAELGVEAEALHAEVGREAAALGIDRVLVVGRFAAAIARGAGQIARVYPDKASLVEALVEMGRAPDVHVLVKGSRSSKMEEIVQGLVQGVAH